MGVKHIKSDAEARQLAAELNSQSRVRPYVVVSTPAASPAPFIDASDVFDQVGDLAAVYVLPTGPESWSFSRAMPEFTQVYGGAGRAYPVGIEWLLDLRKSPLRFAFSAREGKSATDLLVADALRMAGEAGLLTRSASKPVRIDGEIKTVVRPSRAIVRTTDGRHASIWQELVLPDVPVDRTFRPGMRVHGLLDPVAKRYDPTPDLRAPEECLNEYAEGDVVLAEVTETSDEGATLRLYPEVSVPITRDDVTSNELDLVSSLMSPGEVLPVRVIAKNPQWRLSLLDVDDDEEARPAPSLLRGGPPWLVPPPPVERHIVEQTPDPVTDDATIAYFPDPTLASAEQLEQLPADAPPSRGCPSPLLMPRRPSAVRESETAQLTRERDKANRELGRAQEHVASLQRNLVAMQAAMQAERQLIQSELNRATREAFRAADELRRSKTELRKARSKASRTARLDGEATRQFLDDAEQMRHDVYLAWARRVPAAEKDRRPLPHYEFGPEFLGSVDSINGVSRSKIVDVIVEVVTGLAHEVSGRELHPLRTSRNGDAPAVRREDGATCWRAALQVNTPQARRIHYWKLPNGGVELSRVVPHDNFTP